MSDHQQENALRIKAYLENKLSPEEREVFKRSLSENDELRLQYVDALMNRAGAAPDAGRAEDPGEPGESGEAENSGVREDSGEAENSGVKEDSVEAAYIGETEKNLSEVVGESSVDGGGEVHEVEEVEEVHEVKEVEEVHEVKEVEVVEAVDEPQGTWETRGEQGAREAWEAGWPGGKRRARGGFWGSGWMVGLTVLLLVVAVAVMYMMTRHVGLWEKTAAGVAVDSIDAAKVDSTIGATAGKPVAAGARRADTTATRSGAGWGDDLYAKLYKPYDRGNDPREVSVYYQDYRARNYAAVLAKGDSVIVGTGQREVVIRDYMRLYVGLSYLATGDARNAVDELDGVVLRTKPGDILYETARWYLTLAWLKRNDVDSAEARSKALGLAREISHGYSRYREPARELLRDIGN